MARKDRAGTARSPRKVSPAQAVMQAFRSAKSAAPAFMSSCGIFPEVSESASDHLHPIVHDLATKRLGQGRHLRSFQRQIQKLAASTREADRRRVLERISGELTAVLDAQATAAYLFGLSVGLTVRKLPERFDR